MTGHVLDEQAILLTKDAGEIARAVAELLPEGVLGTLAEALGISHRNALGYLTDPDACMSAFWSERLWAVERAQRALGLDWDS